MSTIQIEKNLVAPMRDGVRLATDVYRLEGTAPAPVLVTRTPYDIFVWSAFPNYLAMR